MPGLEQVLHRADVEHGPRDHQASDDSQEIRVEAEQGQHQGEREQSGKDEEVHRRDTQRP